MQHLKLSSYTFYPMYHVTERQWKMKTCNSDVGTVRLQTWSCELQCSKQLPAASFCLKLVFCIVFYINYITAFSWKLSKTAVFVTNSRRKL